MANNIVALESRKLQINVNGIARTIPALHAEWMLPRDWVSYTTPPDPKSELEIPGAKSTWIERANLLIDDLRTLLSMEYNVFWSHVVFDRTFLKNLSRLLKRLPRPHDRHFVYPDADISKSIKEIMSFSFHVILRLSTFKESKKDFMSSDFYARTVYDNFIFDVPKILDICSVYQYGNKTLVAKLIGNVMKAQPQFLNDLKLCSNHIIEAFQRIVQETENLLRSHSREFHISSEFENLIFSSVDLASSLSCLFEAYPESCEVFHQSNPEFTLRIAHFYHNCLNVIDEKVNEELFVGNISEDDSDFFITRLYMAKSKIMHIVRMSIMRCILAPVMNQIKDGDDELEIMLQLYTGYLSEPSLFKDYLQFHPLDDDLDIFRQMGIQIDPMRIEYLRDGVLLHETAKKAQKRPEKPSGPTQAFHESNAHVEGAAAATIEQVCIDESLVSNVKDLFPQLGDGFIAKCLPYFDNSSEKLINALLEDNLPPHLAQLDRTLPKEVPKPVPKPQPQEPTLEVCDNAIDGLDISKLHRGKKKLAKNANALLDDKADLAQMKDRFNALSIVTDDIYLNPGDAEYDDEYDDTYDDNAMGEAEPDALETEREFVLPRALGGGHVASSRNKGLENGDDDSSDDEDKPPKLDFARNPEEIRHEKEQQRQSKMARAQKKPFNQPRDVVGKAKGQGQDKQVLINRARKNANKGKHHRANAEKKMAKGMF